MVHIIGAINQQAPQFDEQTILATLDQPQALQHLATFTGRPATQLFVAEQAVIKLRTDFVFQPKDVERRALAALQEERRLQVHFKRFIQIFTDFCRSLEGSFSALSTPIFAIKYSFCRFSRSTKLSG